VSTQYFILIKCIVFVWLYVLGFIARGYGLAVPSAR